jgi:hypothetical protein
MRTKKKLFKYFYYKGEKMKKVFKWLLLVVLIAALGAVATMLSIYLPKYLRLANYSTTGETRKYAQFITYNDDSLCLQKFNEGSSDVCYLLQGELYNYSNEDQTLVFRFWFTCDIDGEFVTRDDIRAEYIDYEITIPKKSSPNSANPGTYKIFETLPEKFDFYNSVYIGAEVPYESFTNLHSEEEEKTIVDVVINRDGFREVDGVKFTTVFDKCEYIHELTSFAGMLDIDWQGAFDGVIIALSCTGGVLILCLIFTIVLLLPDKKKKEVE